MLSTGVHGAQNMKPLNIFVFIVVNIHLYVYGFFYHGEYSTLTCNYKRKNLLSRGRRVYSTDECLLSLLFSEEDSVEGLIADTHSQLIHNITLCTVIKYTM